MKVLITSGGTSEKIDQVRKISNSATGRLGSLIADAFLEFPDTEVTYICSENAVLPESGKARIWYIEDVQSLKLTLETELRNQKYDAVIHAMAVSDYTVKYSISADALAEYLSRALLQETNFMEADFPKTGEELTAKIQEALIAYEEKQKAGKISSEIENLFLSLEKTPKVIHILKQLQPDMILVGFKLLSDVKEEELLQAAHDLMKKNKCDFVLANDKKNIDSRQHAGVLIGADGSLQYLHTKQEIAQAIVQAVRDKTGKEQTT